MTTPGGPNPDGAGWRANQAFRTARRAMRGLDRDALLATLGGLALDPENAFQQLRLEALAHVAATLPASRGAGVTPADARKVVLARSGSALLGDAPDPPEQPVAVPFVHGSSAPVVLLGLVVGADHDAHRILDVVTELAAGSESVAELEHNIEGILRLVGRISQRASLVGVVEPGGDLERARVPPVARFDTLVRAARLDGDELREELGDWRRTLGPLIGDGVGSAVTWDGRDGSLSYRPFVSTRDGGVALAVPGMVLPALRRHVTSELLRLGPTDLTDRYAQSVWRDVDLSLRLMGLENASTGPRPSSWGDHTLYRVDDAQLLAVALVGVDPFAPEQPERDPGEVVEAAYNELLDHGPGHVVLVVFHAPADEGGFLGLHAPPAGVTQAVMSPADLAVVARAETGEPRTIADYALAASTIRRSARVFAFGSLDEFALFRKNQSSYYFDDEARPTMISVAPGSGLQLRLDAARRAIQDVVQSPNAGASVRVMPRWDASRGIWAPVENVGQPARVVPIRPPVWVLGAPYRRMAAGDEDGWISAVDSVAYWLWELRGHLEPMLSGVDRPVVVTIEGVEEWRTGHDRLGRGPIAFLIDQPQNALRVRTGARFGELARTADNEADRLLVGCLLEGLGQLYGVPTGRPIAEIVDQVAPPGLKKMLLIIDAAANPDIGPDDVPRWRPIREAPVAVVLDELGAALRADGRVDGPAGPKADRLALLHRAVEIVHEMLEREVAAFGPDLLPALLMRNEAILRERAQQGFHLPPRLRCFPEDAAKLRTLTNDLDQASLAGRFLVEYVAARPPVGARVPSLGTLDRLLALADVIVQRGYAGDLEYLDLVDTRARMLGSGRLGIDDRAMQTAIEAFGPWLVAERSADAEAAFATRWHEPTGEAGLAEIDDAARHEWGFTVTEMAQVIGAAAQLSLDEGRAVLAIGIDDGIGQIAQGSGLDVEVVGQVVDGLTLTERPRYERPDRPYEPADAYPWRFNRRLSLLRRPFVRRATSSGPELVFGRRSLIVSAHYTLELVTTSRLRARSREMEQLKGRLSVRRGAAFNERVAVALESHLGRPVRRGVRKVGRLRLQVDGDDIGDVDVLAADPQGRTIWAIECKAVAPARTPYELKQELDELAGSGDDLGLLGKHARRLEWLIAHRDSVLTELRVDGSDWSIRGAFVVDDDLLGPYLHATPVPIMTVVRLLAELAPPGEPAAAP